MPLPLVPDEPLPMPADCRFPDKSFSTAARLPVRAASRSSCSFPIADPKKIRRGAGKRRGKGGLACRSEIPLLPPFFSPTLSYFSVLLVWWGNKSPLSRWIRPSLSTVPLALEEEKFRSAARYHHRANFLWPVPPSLVRHFLETTLSFCVYNLNPFRHTTPTTPALAAW